MVNKGLTSALSSSNSFADNMLPRRSPQRTTLPLKCPCLATSFLFRNFLRYLACCQCNLATNPHDDDAELQP
jgi:hypothetical protein